MRKSSKENGLHTKDEFLEACNSIDFSDYDFIADISNADEKYYLLEGYLFPDTYNFFENESVETTLRRFLDNFESRMEDLQADIAASDYTLDEIITLASIIQAEAANTDDMYMISAILHNRLENGESHDIYSLDCDSTLYYPYNSSTAPEGYVSRYSTYLNNGGVSGLPAGAICNPPGSRCDRRRAPSERRRQRLLLLLPRCGRQPVLRGDGGRASGQSGGSRTALNLKIQSFKIGPCLFRNSG